MHVPDIHASEAIMAATIAGLTTLAGVQLRVILGFARELREVHADADARVDAAHARVDRANEQRAAAASRSRARLEELVDRYHRVIEALGGEGGAS